MQSDLLILTAARKRLGQMSPETARNVLLACWDYLECGAVSESMSAEERVAFSEIFPLLQNSFQHFAQRMDGCSCRR